MPLSRNRAPFRPTRLVGRRFSRKILNASAVFRAACNGTHATRSAQVSDASRPVYFRKRRARRSPTQIVRTFIIFFFLRRILLTRLAAAAAEENERNYYCSIYDGEMRGGAVFSRASRFSPRLSNAEFNTCVYVYTIYIYIISSSVPAGWSLYLMLYTHARTYFTL